MRVRRLARAAATTITVSAVAVTAAPATAAPQEASTGCPRWSTSEVIDGLGILENLVFPADGDGPVISEQSRSGRGGRLLTLDAHHRVRTLVPAEAPGGLVAHGRTVYYTTGTSFLSAFSPRGAVHAVDTRTRRSRTVVRGLTFPNGLARLPGGDFLTTRDIGPSSMSRIHRGHTHRFAPTVASSNGIAYSPSRREVVVSTTFTTVTDIVVLTTGGRVKGRYRLPGVGPLNSADDLTVDGVGNIYVALNAAGKVISVNRATGRVCTVATGLPTVSSVRFGAGDGWDQHSLYATSLVGTVTRITPDR